MQLKIKVNLISTADGYGTAGSQAVWSKWTTEDHDGDTCVLLRWKRLEYTSTNAWTWDDKGCTGVGAYDTGHALCMQGKSSTFVQQEAFSGLRE